MHGTTMAFLETLSGAPFAFLACSFRAALTSDLTTTQVEGSQHLQSASKEPSLHPAKYRRKSKMFMNQGLQKSTRRYIKQYPALKYGSHLLSQLQSCTQVWQSSFKSASKLQSTFYIKTAIERMKSGSNQLKLQLSGSKPNLKDKIEA